MQIHQHTELKRLHTFQLPGSAHTLIECDEPNELAQILQQYPDLHILGSGSNTLFIGDIKIPLLRLTNQQIEIKQTASDYFVTVGAGVDWPSFVENMVAQGIHGAENLALIPGQVGSAPVQNIGAYGVELNALVERVNCFDREQGLMTCFTAEACDFSYRDSLFKHTKRYIICSVCFRFPRVWQPKLAYGPLRHLDPQTAVASDVMQAVVATRQAKLPDPDVLPNAGSFFKNPIVKQSLADELKLQYPQIPIYPVDDQQVKLAAGWLIDQLGLKGFSIGDAAVHTEQALVLVNHGHATASQLLALACSIQEQVQNAYGVALEMEPRLIGPTGEMTQQEAMAYVGL